MKKFMTFIIGTIFGTVLGSIFSCRILCWVLEKMDIDFDLYIGTPRNKYLSYPFHYSRK